MSASPAKAGCFEACGGTPQCAIDCSNQGSGSGGLINLNELINTTLGSMKFKFIGADASLGKIVSNLIPFFLGFAGIGLLLYLIYGGFSYLTSSGDPKKTEAAKGIITNAIIGFFLVVVAFWLTQLLNFIFHLGSGFG